MIAVCPFALNLFGFNLLPLLLFGSLSTNVRRSSPNSVMHYSTPTQGICWL